jgi:hypothetical protein
MRCLLHSGYAGDFQRGFTVNLASERGRDLTQLHALQCKSYARPVNAAGKGDIALLQSGKVC